MKILGLEFSSGQRSAAVAVDGQRRGLAVEAPESRRATRAFALIEAALAEAGLRREEIECIAVGLGPGSYTGIRVAIALAQGWQLARGVKLLGIGSVEGLAALAWETTWAPVPRTGPMEPVARPSPAASSSGVSPPGSSPSETLGKLAGGTPALRGSWQGKLSGRVHVVIDAQRNELYLATYEIVETGWQERAPLRLAALAEVQALAAAGDLVIGPELARFNLPGRTIFPSALQIALLAEGRTDFVSGEDLAPIYLRPVAFVKAPPARTL